MVGSLANLQLVCMVQVSLWAGLGLKGWEVAAWLKRLCDGMSTWILGRDDFKMDCLLPGWQDCLVEWESKWKTVLWCIGTVDRCCKWRSESIEVLCKRLFSHKISAHLCSGNRLWWKIVFLFFGTTILALKSFFFCHYYSQASGTGKKYENGTLILAIV